MNRRNIYLKKINPSDPNIHLNLRPQVLLAQKENDKQRAPGHVAPH